MLGHPDLEISFPLSPFLYTYLFSCRLHSALVLESCSDMSLTVPQGELYEDKIFKVIY